MRLLLAIPTAGAPAKPFLDSLSGLKLPLRTEHFERFVVTGNFVPAQRDVLIERALEIRADVVVMCDDDMVLPPDALPLLCAALDADAGAGAAGALYYSRDGLRPMAVDGWDPHDSTRGWIPAFDDRTPVAVDGVGFGCVAIRTSATRDFARPFFASHVYVESAAARVRVCDEDYLFCARLRGAGFRVLLHPGVRCGHFDRGRNATAPARWETPEATGMKRVLVRNGDRFELVPLGQTSAPPASETRLQADVTYIVTKGT